MLSQWESWLLGFVIASLIVAAWKYDFLHISTAASWSKRAAWGLGVGVFVLIAVVTMPLRPSVTGAIRATDKAMTKKQAVEREGWETFDRVTGANTTR